MATPYSVSNILTRAASPTQNIRPARAARSRRSLRSGRALMTSGLRVSLPGGRAGLSVRDADGTAQSGTAAAQPAVAGERGGGPEQPPAGQTEYGGHADLARHRAVDGHQGRGQPDQRRVAQPEYEREDDTAGQGGRAPTGGPGEQPAGERPDRNGRGYDEQVRPEAQDQA